MLYRIQFVPFWIQKLSCRQYGCRRITWVKRTRCELSLFCVSDLHSDFHGEIIEQRDRISMSDQSHSSSMHERRI
jgi:hypothetical protein